MENDGGKCRQPDEINRRSGVDGRIAEISGGFFGPINFASNKICADLYSAGRAFFFREARF